MSKKRKSSASSRRRRRRKIILIVEVIVLLLLLAGLFVWFKFGMINFDNISDISMNNLNSETEEVLEGYTTVALFGVDNRTSGNYDVGNSDSIMVCSIDNKTKEVRIVSVYRDAYLDTGDDTFHKANYAYNHGGVESALAMLNRNLDLDIQEYVAVDFAALVDAVDAVGGVDLDEGLSKAEVQDMNIDHAYVYEVAEISGKKATPVETGQTHLNGVQATAYCRVRYTDSDFVRTQRQRTVLTKLVEKAKKASVSELNALVDAIFPEVSTSLSMKEILALAAGYSEYELVDTKGYPFDKKGTTLGKKGYVVVPCTLESNAIELHEFLYADENYVPSDDLSKLSKEIINNTGFDKDDALDYGDNPDMEAVEESEDTSTESSTDTNKKQ